MIDWAHIPQHIDPIMFSIGAFQIHWYGVMYIAAFTTVYLLVLYRIRTEHFLIDKETIADFMLWVILAVLIGGRLGYVIFYDFNFFITHPLEIILPFSFDHGFRFTGISGMSYHGGLIGVVLVFSLFCYKKKINFWRLTDLFIPAVALGYTFGRIGNFLNGELYGRITTMPWGMYFPSDPTEQLRHPSQIYEAFFEGIFLFVLLWSIRKKKWSESMLLALYLIGYGTVRFFIEFVRQPDIQLGFVLGPFTMGQILCFCMIFIGGVIALFQAKRKFKTKSP